MLRGKIRKLSVIVLILLVMSMPIVAAAEQGFYMGTNKISLKKDKEIDSLKFDVPIMKDLFIELPGLEGFLEDGESLEDYTGENEVADQLSKDMCGAMDALFNDKFNEDNVRTYYNEINLLQEQLIKLGSLNDAQNGYFNDLLSNLGNYLDYSNNVYEFNNNAKNTDLDSIIENTELKNSYLALKETGLIGGNQLRILDKFFKQIDDINVLSRIINLAVLYEKETDDLFLDEISFELESLNDYNIKRDVSALSPSVIQLTNLRGAELEKLNVNNVIDALKDNSVDKFAEKKLRDLNKARSPSLKSCNFNNDPNVRNLNRPLSQLGQLVLPEKSIDPRKYVLPTVKESNCLDGVLAYLHVVGSFASTFFGLLGMNYVRNSGAEICSMPGILNLITGAAVYDDVGEYNKKFLPKSFNLKAGDEKSSLESFTLQAVNLQENDIGEKISIKEPSVSEANLGSSGKIELIGLERFRAIFEQFDDKVSCKPIEAPESAPLIPEELIPKDLRGKGAAEKERIALLDYKWPNEDTDLYDFSGLLYSLGDLLGKLEGLLGKPEEGIKGVIRKNSEKVCTPINDKKCLLSFAKTYDDLVNKNWNEGIVKVHPKIKGTKYFIDRQNEKVRRDEQNDFFDADKVFMQFEVVEEVTDNDACRNKLQELIDKLPDGEDKNNLQKKLDEGEISSAQEDLKKLEKDIEKLLKDIKKEETILDSKISYRGGMSEKDFKKLQKEHQDNLKELRKLKKLEKLNAKSLKGEKRKKELSAKIKAKIKALESKAMPVLFILKDKNGNLVDNFEDWIDDISKRKEDWEKKIKRRENLKEFLDAYKKFKKMLPKECRKPVELDNKMWLMEKYQENIDEFERVAPEFAGNVIKTLEHFNRYQKYSDLLDQCPAIEEDKKKYEKFLKENLEGGIPAELSVYLSEIDCDKFKDNAEAAQKKIKKSMEGLLREIDILKYHVDNLDRIKRWLTLFRDDADEYLAQVKGEIQANAMYPGTLPNIKQVAQTAKSILELVEVEERWLSDKDFDLSLKMDDLVNTEEEVNFFIGYDESVIEPEFYEESWENIIDAYKNLLEVYFQEHLVLSNYFDFLFQVAVNEANSIEIFDSVIKTDKVLVCSDGRTFKIIKDEGKCNSGSCDLVLPEKPEGVPPDYPEPELDYQGMLDKLKEKHDEFGEELEKETEAEEAAKGYVDKLKKEGNNDKSAELGEIDKFVKRLIQKLGMDLDGSFNDARLRDVLRQIKESLDNARESIIKDAMKKAGVDSEAKLIPLHGPEIVKAMRDYFKNLMKQLFDEEVSDAEAEQYYKAFKALQKLIDDVDNEGRSLFGVLKEKVKAARSNLNEDDYKKKEQYRKAAANLISDNEKAVRSAREIAQKVLGALPKLFRPNERAQERIIGAAKMPSMNELFNKFMEGKSKEEKDLALQGFQEAVKDFIDRRNKQIELYKAGEQLRILETSLDFEIKRLEDDLRKKGVDNKKIQDAVAKLLQQKKLQMEALSKKVNQLACELNPNCRNSEELDNDIKQLLEQRKKGATLPAFINPLNNLIKKFKGFADKDFTDPKVQEDFKKAIGVRNDGLTRGINTLLFQDTIKGPSGRFEDPIKRFDWFNKKLEEKLKLAAEGKINGAGLIKFILDEATYRGEFSASDLGGQLHESLQKFDELIEAGIDQDDAIKGLINGFDNYIEDTLRKSRTLVNQRFTKQIIEKLMLKMQQTVNAEDRREIFNEILKYVEEMGGKEFLEDPNAIQLWYLRTRIDNKDFEEFLKMKKLDGEPISDVGFRRVERSKEYYDNLEKQLDEQRKKIADPNIYENARKDAESRIFHLESLLRTKGTKIKFEGDLLKDPNKYKQLLNLYNELKRQKLPDMSEEKIKATIKFWLPTSKDSKETSMGDLLNWIRSVKTNFEREDLVDATLRGDKPYIKVTEYGKGFFDRRTGKSMFRRIEKFDVEVVKELFTYMKQLEFQIAKSEVAKNSAKTPDARRRAKSAIPILKDKLARLRNSFSEQVMGDLEKYMSDLDKLVDKRESERYLARLRSEEEAKREAEKPLLYKYLKSVGPKFRSSSVGLVVSGKAYRKEKTLEQEYGELKFLRLQFLEQTLSAKEFEKRASALLGYEELGRAWVDYKKKLLSLRSLEGLDFDQFVIKFNIKYDQEDEEDLRAVFELIKGSLTGKQVSINQAIARASVDKEAGLTDLLDKISKDLFFLDDEDAKDIYERLRAFFRDNNIDIGVGYVTNQEDWEEQFKQVIIPYLENYANSIVNNYNANVQQYLRTGDKNAFYNALKYKAMLRKSENFATRLKRIFDERGDTVGSKSEWSKLWAKLSTGVGKVTDEIFDLNLARTESQFKIISENQAVARTLDTIARDEFDPKKFLKDLNDLLRPDKKIENFGKARAALNHIQYEQRRKLKWFGSMMQDLQLFEDGIDASVFDGFGNIVLEREKGYVQHLYEEGNTIFKGLQYKKTIADSIGAVDIGLIIFSGFLSRIAIGGILRLGSFILASDFAAGAGAAARFAAIGGNALRSIGTIGKANMMAHAVIEGIAFHAANIVLRMGIGKGKLSEFAELQGYYHSILFLGSSAVGGKIFEVLGKAFARVTGITARTVLRQYVKGAFSTVFEGLVFAGAEWLTAPGGDNKLTLDEQNDQAILRNIIFMAALKFGHKLAALPKARLNRLKAESERVQKQLEYKQRKIGELNRLETRNEGQNKKLSDMFKEVEKLNNRQKEIAREMQSTDLSRTGVDLQKMLEEDPSLLDKYSKGELGETGVDAKFKKLIETFKNEELQKKLDSVKGLIDGETVKLAKEAVERELLSDLKESRKIRELGEAPTKEKPELLEVLEIDIQRLIDKDPSLALRYERVKELRAKEEKGELTDKEDLMLFKLGKEIVELEKSIQKLKDKGMSEEEIGKFIEEIRGLKEAPEKALRDIEEKQWQDLKDNLPFGEKPLVYDKLKELGFTPEQARSLMPTFAARVLEIGSLRDLIVDKTLTPEQALRITMDVLYDMKWKRVDLETGEVRTAEDRQRRIDDQLNQLVKEGVLSEAQAKSSIIRERINANLDKALLAMGGKPGEATLAAERYETRRLENNRKGIFEDLLRAKDASEVKAILNKLRSEYHVSDKVFDAFMKEMTTQLETVERLEITRAKEIREKRDNLQLEVDRLQKEYGDKQAEAQSLMEAGADMIKVFKLLAESRSKLIVAQRNLELAKARQGVSFIEPNKLPKVEGKPRRRTLEDLLLEDISEFNEIARGAQGVIREATLKEKVNAGGKEFGFGAREVVSKSDEIGGARKEALLADRLTEKWYKTEGATDSIARFIGVAKVGKNLRLVYEKVEGLALGEFLRRGGKLTAKQLSSLEYAVKRMHDLGFVHNDLSPYNMNNVIVKSNGKLVLVDFGKSFERTTNTEFVFDRARDRDLEFVQHLWENYLGEKFRGLPEDLPSPIKPELRELDVRDATEKGFMFHGSPVEFGPGEIVRTSPGQMGHVDAYRTLIENIFEMMRPDNMPSRVNSVYAGRDWKIAAKFAIKGSVYVVRSKEGTKILKTDQNIFDEAVEKARSKVGDKVISEAEGIEVLKSVLKEALEYWSEHAKPITEEVLAGGSLDIIGKAMLPTKGDRVKLLTEVKNAKGEVAREGEVGVLRFAGDKFLIEVGGKKFSVDPKNIEYQKRVDITKRLEKDIEAKDKALDYEERIAGVVEKLNLGEVNELFKEVKTIRELLESSINEFKTFKENLPPRTELSLGSDGRFEVRVDGALNKELTERYTELRESISDSRERLYEAQKKLNEKVIDSRSRIEDVAREQRRRQEVETLEVVGELPGMLSGGAKIVQGVVSGNQYIFKAASAAEIQLHQKLIAEGLPVPRIIRKVKLEGQEGYVMELIEGKSLFNRESSKFNAEIELLQGKLRRKEITAEEFNELGSLAEDKMFDSLSTKQLETLESSILKMHELGIAHGDLSTMNIMITSKGELKIIDFGQTRSKELHGERIYEDAREIDLTQLDVVRKALKSRVEEGLPIPRALTDTELLRQIREATSLVESEGIMSAGMYDPFSIAAISVLKGMRWAYDAVRTRFKARAERKAAEAVDLKQLGKKEIDLMSDKVVKKKLEQEMQSNTKLAAMIEKYYELNRILSEVEAREQEALKVSPEVQKAMNEFFKLSDLMRKELPTIFDLMKKSYGEKISDRDLSKVKEIREKQFKDLESALPELKIEKRPSEIEKEVKDKLELYEMSTESYKIIGKKIDELMNKNIGMPRDKFIELAVEELLGTSYKKLKELADKEGKSVEEFAVSKGINIYKFESLKEVIEISSNLLMLKRIGVKHFWNELSQSEYVVNKEIFEIIYGRSAGGLFLISVKPELQARIQRVTDILSEVLDYTPEQTKSLKRAFRNGNILFMFKKGMKLESAVESTYHERVHEKQLKLNKDQWEKFYRVLDRHKDNLEFRKFVEFLEEFYSFQKRPGDRYVDRKEVMAYLYEAMVYEDGKIHPLMDAARKFVKSLGKDKDGNYNLLKEFEQVDSELGNVFSGAEVPKYLYKNIERAFHIAERAELEGSKIFRKFMEEQATILAPKEAAKQVLEREKAELSKPLKIEKEEKTAERIIESEYKLDIGELIDRGKEAEVFDGTIFYDKDKTVAGRKIKAGEKVSVVVREIPLSDRSKAELHKELQEAYYELDSIPSHGGIPRILEIKQVGNKLQVVMEKVGQENLADYLIKTGDLEILARQKEQMEKILSAVHDAGFVHGDLHERNWMIKGKEIWLIDFGLIQRKTSKLVEKDLKDLKEIIEAEVIGVVHPAQEKVIEKEKTLGELLDGAFGNYGEKVGMYDPFSLAAIELFKGARWVYNKVRVKFKERSEKTKAKIEVEDTREVLKEIKNIEELKRRVPFKKELFGEDYYKGLPLELVEKIKQLEELNFERDIFDYLENKEKLSEINEKIKNLMLDIADSAIRLDTKRGHELTAEYFGSLILDKGSTFRNVEDVRMGYFLARAFRKLGRYEDALDLLSEIQKTLRLLHKKVPNLQEVLDRDFNSLKIQLGLIEDKNFNSQLEEIEVLQGDEKIKKIDSIIGKYPEGNPRRADLLSLKGEEYYKKAKVSNSVEDLRETYDAFDSIRRNFDYIAADRERAQFVINNIWERFRFLAEKEDFSGNLEDFAKRSMPEPVRKIESYDSNIVEENKKMFGEIYDVAFRESMGGNAGEGHVGVNIFIDRNTGKIIAVGNLGNARLGQGPIVNMKIRRPRVAGITLRAHAYYSFFTDFNKLQLSTRAINNLRKTLELYEKQALKKLIDGELKLGKLASARTAVENAVVLKEFNFRKGFATNNLELLKIPTATLRERIEYHLKQGKTVKELEKTPELLLSEIKRELPVPKVLQKELEFKEREAELREKEKQFEDAKAQGSKTIDELQSNIPSENLEFVDYITTGLTRTGMRTPIWRVRDKVTGKEFAFKRVGYEVVNDLAYLDVALQELAWRAGLSVPKVIGFTEINGKKGYLQELINGEIVIDLVRGGKQGLFALTNEQLEAIVKTVEKLHELGITHNDLIRGANIMLTEDGRIKIIDFGNSVYRGHGEADFNRILWKDQLIVDKIKSIIEGRKEYEKLSINEQGNLQAERGVTLEEIIKFHEESKSLLNYRSKSVDKWLQYYEAAKQKADGFPDRLKSYESDIVRNVLRGIPGPNKLIFPEEFAGFVYREPGRDKEQVARARSVDKLTSRNVKDIANHRWNKEEPSLLGTKAVVYKNNNGEYVVRFWEKTHQLHHRDVISTLLEKDGNINDAKIVGRQDGSSYPENVLERVLGFQLSINERTGKLVSIDWSSSSAKARLAADVLPEFNDFINMFEKFLKSIDPSLLPEGPIRIGTEFDHPFDKLKLEVELSKRLGREVVLSKIDGSERSLRFIEEQATVLAESEIETPRIVSLGMYDPFSFVVKGLIDMYKKRLELRKALREGRPVVVRTEQGDVGYKPGEKEYEDMREKLTGAGGTARSLWKIMVYGFTAYSAVALLNLLAIKHPEEMEGIPLINSLIAPFQESSVDLLSDENISGLLKKAGYKYNIYDLDVPISFALALNNRLSERGYPVVENAGDLNKLYELYTVDEILDPEGLGLMKDAIKNDYYLKSITALDGKFQPILDLYKNEWAKGNEQVLALFELLHHPLAFDYKKNPEAVIEQIKSLEVGRFGFIAWLQGLSLEKINSFKAQGMNEELISKISLGYTPLSEVEIQKYIDSGLFELIGNTALPQSHLRAIQVSALMTIYPTTYSELIKVINELEGVMDIDQLIDSLYESTDKSGWSEILIELKNMGAQELTKDLVSQMSVYLSNNRGTFITEKVFENLRILKSVGYNFEELYEIVSVYPIPAKGGTIPFTVRDLLVNRVEFEELLKQMSLEDAANKFAESLKEESIAGEKFFSESASNFNSNKEKFSESMKAEGISITLTGDVQSFSKDGTLTGKNGNINIRQFKEKYNFEVDELGDIKLIDKSNTKHDFTGTIKKDSAGNIQLDEGSINGKYITRGTNLRFSEDGKTLLGNAKEFGGLAFSEETSFTYNKKTNLLSLKDIKIKSESYITNIYVTGNNVVLEKGITLTDGIIKIEGMNSFVSGNAIINGIDINSKEYEKVQLFVDGIEHKEIDGPYVSLDPQSRKLFAYSGKLASVNINFMPGQRYFDMERSDGPVLFKISRDTKLSVERRDALIPEVILQKDMYSTTVETASIFDGGKKFMVQEGKWYDFSSEYKQTGSVPMVVKIQDFEGNNLLGTATEPKKMIISNYDVVGNIPLEAKTEIATEGFTKTVLSESLYFNYAGERLNLLFDDELSIKGIETIEGAGAFKGSDPMEFLTAVQRIKLLSKLRFIPDHIWKAKKIVIYDDATWKEENPSIGGFAIGGELHISIHILESATTDTFYHENLHNYHFTIEGMSWENIWKRNTLYGLDAGPPVVGRGNKKYNFASWEDGSSEPRYGFVEEYSANNVYEDFASTAPYIILRSKLYASLVNPESKFYIDRMGKDYADGTMTPARAQEWADIYSKKLFFASSLGAIPPDIYNEIVNSIGQQDFKEALIRSGVREDIISIE